jgi:hypothetical protein
MGKSFFFIFVPEVVALGKHFWRMAGTKEGRNAIAASMLILPLTVAH